MANKINPIILAARASRCSDVHISEGLDLMFRLNGSLHKAPYQYESDETKEIILDMLTAKQRQQLDDGKDVDFALTTSDMMHQRVNVFRQQGKLAATIRLINDTILNLETLGMPKILYDLAEQPRGMVLVTGPTGSGKSTTLAAMVDHINTTRTDHIITIEDPIEYVYETKQSLIHQREVGNDVDSFAAALRSALREDPDVILVGEMRDYETISAAITAAETGHLVLSTLHTTGAAQTIDRIIDACPSASQNQIRTQLTGVLRGVITQTLIPNIENNYRVPATEILIGSDAAMNVIRESRTHQLKSIMQSSGLSGMHTLNGDLARLVRENKISSQNAYRYSNDKDDLKQFLPDMQIF